MFDFSPVVWFENADIFSVTTEKLKSGSKSTQFVPLSTSKNVTPFWCSDLFAKTSTFLFCFTVANSPNIVKKLSYVAFPKFKKIDNFCKKKLTLVYKSMTLVYK